MPTSPNRSSPTQRTRVLAVDDMPPNLIAIEAVLEPIPIELMFARSGAEALRVAEEVEFAVILLDMQMPGMDGFETLERLRRGRAKDTPVIFITAHAHSPELVRRAYDLGAFDFVTKPYDAYVLRGKVRAFVAFYERGRQLQQQQVALEMKDRYLGILAHDLRTPLAVLHMGTQSILGGATAADAVRFAGIMSRSVQRMGQLVEDLLEFARAAAHRMPIRKSAMDLASLCEEVLNDARSAHPTVAFVADLADNAQGTWDRERLHQVLANLLSNAVKYGDGRVHVRLSADEAWVSLAVTNGGEPIPANRLDVIFEPFVQAGERNGGVGLGLSIVREIVHSHGGEVGVSSDRECTCFSVRLPRIACDGAR